MKTPQRRFTNHFVRKPLTLSQDHVAVVEGRTIFRSRVVETQDRILKEGINQRKLGSHVAKGAWRGMPIYTLTLEERATCPRSCEHWRDCYGNHMHHPKRQRPSEAMIEQLGAELEVLAIRFPAGFVVRLHILGDFYSTDYVRQWAEWMETLSMLHVFGYTARDPKEPIGRGLSTGDSGIVCPVQTGKTDCCGTCALCWTVEKPIRFLVH